MYTHGTDGLTDSVKLLLKNYTYYDKEKVYTHGTDGLTDSVKLILKNYKYYNKEKVK